MFLPIDIQYITQIINQHYSFMIFTFLGEGVLSDYDRAILESYGIDIEKLREEFPPYMQMFMLGRLTAILEEKQSKELTQEDFQKYLEKGQFIPLSEREREEYSISREMTYSHLKGLANKVTDSTRNKMLEENKKQLIQEVISEGVKDRKSISSIVSDLGHRTGEWDRDWTRIVTTEMQNIYNQGRASMVARKFGDDSLVWKQVYPLACKHCIRLYLTYGIGSEPRVFKLSTLIENGNNIGRKVDDWKAVVPVTHPYCFSNSRTPIYTSKGWKKIEDIKVGDLVLTHKGRFREVDKLLFREVNTQDISCTYSVIVELNNKKRVSIRGVTSDHPIMSDNNWTKISDLLAGDRVTFLYDRCMNPECTNIVPVYNILLRNNTTSNLYCSRFCANSRTAKKQWKNPKMRESISSTSKRQMTEKYRTMSLESRRRLTSNGRSVVQKMLDSGTHPFLLSETKIKANKQNGKKCTFIELKLRYFLDQLGVDYRTDFYIERKELKSNGQKRLYFPDIYIPELNIVLEADGVNWHEDIKLDNKRDSDIKKLIGADTFRFKEEDIRNNGRVVFEELKRIIKNHRGEYNFRDAKVVEIKRNILKSNSLITLYNFSVEEDESYIANGFVVHNCRCDIRNIHKGQVWSKETSSFEYIADRERKVERTSKIKIAINEKEFFV